MTHIDDMPMAQERGHLDPYNWIKRPHGIWAAAYLNFFTITYNEKYHHY